MRWNNVVSGLASLAALALPAAAHAQSYSCAVPTLPQQVHPDLPGEQQPTRILPIGGYTLAITWAPEYCHANARKPEARFECGSGNRFGFTLHGLWPDGVAKDWPQYCRSTALVPQAVIRGAMCATPSAQLIQHEWAKHGTCMPGLHPADFFARSTGLYGRLHYPDMVALSRSRPLTAGRIASAIARANPGMTADMMRITANARGWLDEVWFCLDTRFAYARCPVHQRGLAADTPIKIWRGRT